MADENENVQSQETEEIDSQDLDNYSDEEFLEKFDPEKVSDNSAEETKQEPEENTSEETNSSDNLTTENNQPDNNQEEPEPEDENSLQELTPEQYKEFYTKVMAPFKVRGKMISLKSPEEAIQLMQKGTDYTQKTQQLSKYRRLTAMLEQNKLLDEAELSFLIDLKNKEPEAVKKFMKDAGIDPLDIDTTTEPNYQAGKHIVTDAQLNFDSAIKEIAEQPNGTEALKEIQKWDNPSINSLYEDPTRVGLIYDHMQTGVYNTIVTEMSRLKSIGQLPNQPFLANYLAVGNSLLAQKQQQQQQNNPVPQEVARRPAVRTNNSRVRQAAITGTGGRKSQAIDENFDFSKMSDEEFLKATAGRF